ncbi:MAG: monovalent cation/H(+) antiporter subunit G [Chlorobi bacterium]|nr:monovalent cation/H(+) antiporter subunit G [Chlorobiota bacterium]
MSLLEIIGGIFILVGSVFLFLGGLGIFRMPDVYNRLQAGTKATTLGAMSVILGVGISQAATDWTWILKTLVIVIFIAYSNPISSHALARAMYKRKKFPLVKSKAENMDAYREIIETEKEEVKS